MSIDHKVAPPRQADLVLGLASIATAAAAVVAWAACCVLPIGLSIVGVSLAGTSWLAGQRTWLTLLSLPALAVGWWLVWRRRNQCAVDPACRPPSHLTIGLLATGSALTLVALVWQPILEPWLLGMLRQARG